MVGLSRWLGGGRFLLKNSQSLANIGQVSHTFPPLSFLFLSSPLLLISLSINIELSHLHFVCCIHLPNLTATAADRGLWVFEGDAGYNFLEIGELGPSTKIRLHW